MKMSASVRLWPCLLLVLIASPSTGLPTFVDASGSHAMDRSFAARERSAFQPAIHKARFNDIPHTLASSSCEKTQPPEALATPSPLLPGTPADEALIVSFIVGTDGRVHSALVLQGGDNSDDRLVLAVVRHWRYRPATCNGVPTESEAKVEFSRPHP
jgi:TonB family protein